MKKTGQLLKDKREAAKLSLSEVALATKINPKILTAIENGDEALLPAKTFLRGFLKAYALFLKIDPDEVLRSYQDEMGGPPPVREHEINKPMPVVPASAAAPSAPRRRLGDENSSGLRTAAVVVIVMLIGVIIGVRELIEKYQREKTVESAAIKVSPLAQPALVPETKPAEAPPAAVTPTTPAPADASATPPPAAAGSPETPAPAKPAQNDIVIAPPVTGAPAPTTPAPAVVPPPAPQKPEAKAPVKEEAKAAPKSEPEKKAAATPDVVPPASDTVKTETAPEPKKAGQNEIILEALDKVDVKFQIKGETKRVSLGPTQVHTIRSDQPVTLDLSDGGAVNIILNGRERGVPGDLGKPKTIKIP